MEHEIRDDALDVLREVPTWRLAGGRWPAVVRELGVLAEAVAAQDTDGVRQGVRGLELAGPARVVRIEDAPVEPAPELVRLRVAELVHTLEAALQSDGHDTGYDAAAAPE